MPQATVPHTYPNWEDTPLGRKQAEWRATKAAIEAEQQEFRDAHKDEIAAADAEFARNKILKRAALIRFHAARRRVVKLQRTPPWADQDKILAIYRQARAMTDATGVVHHVDHVYPLQGELVSGLHVHTNLQVLPWRENVSKGNRFEVAP
jgi:hypothetical protein